MYNETLGLWLPDVVLDFTEYKRAIIVGGQRGREERCNRLQKIFGFSSLTYENGERSSVKHALRVREAVLSHQVDIVFVLVAFSNHQIDHILSEVCKKTGVPLIRVNNGDGPNAFSRSIESQIPKAVLAHA